MSQIYSSLGMMSGTSFDGVDISIIETDGKDRVILKKISITLMISKQN
jgi:Predicted molecular chaperone distantly related to HSP70-fold metalloproteases